MKRAFPGRPSRRRFCALVAGVLLGALSCGRPHSSETTKQGPSPPVKIKDPIISMMMASSIGAKGELVNPRFSFPQTEPQITAIVHLGNVKSFQLTVAWYKTSDDGDTKLFEHQIQVKSRDRAFSVAKNPGGPMSVGTYKVVATIDGQTKDAEFDITPPKAAPNKTSNNREDKNSDELLQAISYDPVSDQSRIQKIANPSGTTSPGPTGSTAAQGKSPVGGQSGTVRPSGDFGNFCIGDPDGCTDQFTDSDADQVEVYIFSRVATQEVVHVWEGPTSEHQLGVIESGSEGTLKFDPCWAPDKDLPGTKVSFTAQLGNKTVTTQVVLGDDTLAPRLKVVSTPARGTKVKTGDKINLKVTATEKRSGGPWQTGVKIIQITAQPGGLVKEPWINPSALPKACAEKTWEKKDEAAYTVPSNPPPIIKICAVTEDYAGNESSQCGEFVTGDKWDGMMHSETNYIGRAPNGGIVTCTGEAWDFDLHLVVGGDGTLEGKAIGRLASMPKCASNPPISFDYSRQAKNSACDVSGKFDGQQFRLVFVETQIDGSTLGLINYSLMSWKSLGLITTLIVPVTSATTAQGETSTNVDPVPMSGGLQGASGHHSINLKCTTCK